MAKKLLNSLFFFPHHLINTINSLGILQGYKTIILKTIAKNQKPI